MSVCMQTIYLGFSFLTNTCSFLRLSLELVHTQPFVFCGTINFTPIYNFKSAQSYGSYKSVTRPSSQCASHLVHPVAADPNFSSIFIGSYLRSIKGQTHR